LNLDGTFNLGGRDVFKTVCETSNLLGNYGKTGASYEYVNLGGDYSYPVLNGGLRYSVVPVPNQPTLATLVSDNLEFWGTPLRLFNSFSEAGTIQPVYSNINELAFKFRTPLSEPLKNSSGGILYVRNPAFSNNGEWMVVEVINTGFVRINTITRQMQLISSERYNYGLGFTPALILAISDDGNTFIRSSLNVGATIAYDLSGCQQVPIVPATGQAALAPGCKSRSLQSDLLQHFSNYKGIYRMTFDETGKSISGIVILTSPTGANQYYEMTYSVAGFAPAERTTYLGLGDSFSSGEGAGDYNPLTNVSSNRCHVSYKSYPYLVARSVGLTEGERFRSVACSNAVSNDYFFDAQEDSAQEFIWLAGESPQNHFVKRARPDAVTISMIGNDIGFPEKIRNCMGTHSCFHYKEERQAVASEIVSKFNTLVTMYEHIQASSPGVRVYVVGYPQIVSATGPCALNVHLTDEERVVARGLATYLNAVIKSATERAGVVYIDVENAFEGHQLCQDAEDVNGLTLGVGTPFPFGPFSRASFHPTASGQMRMSWAVLDQSNYLTKPMPVLSSKTDLSKIPPYVGSPSYEAFIGNAPSNGSAEAAKQQIRINRFINDNILRGSTVNINQSVPNLKPNSTFQAWFYSTPTPAGTLTTDANGKLTGDITVPTGLEPGYHTFRVDAKNIADEDIVLYKEVFVSAYENDLDGDGILNSEDPCLAVEPANIDQDHDGTDDACDGVIDKVPADITPPVVIGTPDRAANSAGWYDRDVTISWTATDPDPSAGAPTQPANSVASQEGTNTYTSDESCDPLNNCATGSLEIKIDKTAPNITYSLNPSSTADGWNNSSVTVTFSCSDATSGVANCEEPQTVAGTDGVYIVTGYVTDNAGNANSVNVIVSVDTTKPTLTQASIPTANNFGWNNSDVTVTPTCSDGLSGVKTCSLAETLTTEGADQVVTSTATDYAGNSGSASSTIKIDKTAPILGAVTWSNNPKSTASISSLSIEASDNLAGITEAEYFIGDTDPGQGNGATMQVGTGSVSVDFGTDFPTGVYKISVRAKDAAGNWSLIVSDYLVVFDPVGVHMTAHKKLTPSLANNDSLPGLIDNTQTDEATFGFNVRYNDSGLVHPESDFQIKYQTGTNCRKLALAQNCHSFDLNSTAIAWLATQGTNNSTGIFQGTARLVIDGVTTSVLFRVIGIDGQLLGVTNPDNLTVKVYNLSDNPNTASPLYRVSGSLPRGNILISNE
jgi:hypothetical protein